MDIQIGDRIDDRYRLTSRVAKGGMAEIYEATDVINKRQCAVKFMLEDLLKSKNNIERFDKEAKLEARLSHPNIVKVYGNGMYFGRPYMVLEFIKGQTLREKLDFLTNINYIEACEMMYQLCDAVSYCHNRGIIHRDIKPDNIYCTPDGTIKLGDFGIALDLNEKSAVDDSNILGSVHYLAPEICQSKPASIQSDIYAIGVTFFELVTHRLPFEKEEVIDIAVAQVNEKFPHPSEFQFDLPPSIERIILKACSKNPLDRYKSASEMMLDLHDIISNKKSYTKRRSILSKLFGFKED